MTDIVVWSHIKGARIVSKVCVMGSGTMGTEIAYVFANNENQVIVYDIGQKFIDNAIKRIESKLNKQLESNKIEKEKYKEILNNLRFTTAIKEMKDCDLVVEAIVEDMATKKEVFKEIDEICKPETVFVSNTSSLSITELASAVKRSEKFMGMHFFNPASAMKLVELIRGLQTSNETFDYVENFAKRLNKQPVEVNEAPGFVVNKILIPMINEAIIVLEDGVATKEDIDKAMMLGANHPMGPLALSDFIGNDIVLKIMNVIYEETGDSKYRPATLLKKMVRAGKLGRKSNCGFYNY